VKFKRLFAALLVIGCAVAGTLAVTGGPAAAIPVRDVTPWTVLLCRFSDKPATPKPVTFFADFLTDAGKGTGGMADYLAGQSFGRVTLTGSTVQGWYTMTWTLAQYQTIDRATRIQRCVDTASAAGYAVPAGNRVAVVLNDTVDGGSAGGRVLLDPAAWNMRFAAHEMLHGYALGHSYSDDATYQNATWSQPGEYDDMWDEMSAQHTYAVATANYGASAIGLNAYNRDKLGWLPMNRVVTVGADGTGSRTITLAPLESPSAPGPLLVRIPVDPTDPFDYYTVEYRRKLGASAGIPGDTILLHEIKNGIPYLLRTGAGGAPAQSLDARGVQLAVTSMTGDAATVTITTPVVGHHIYGPNTCATGYVWRAADQNDYVCVPPDTRTQAAADNAATASRWVKGVYGPHTCVAGFVWREAFTGDDTCVTTDQRTAAAADNAAAPTRLQRPAD
jgi:hypothetical protein